MSRTAYLLVFDGFADWEPALATCEIRRSGRFDVATVGFAADAVVSMGGLRVVPDVILREVDTDGAAALILPGGDVWEAGPRPALHPLLHRLVEAGVPVAAICGATLEIARAGLHAGRRHTSNALDYLKAHVERYAEEHDYVAELAVRDRGLITASGAGHTELARELLLELGIYDEPTAAAWYDLFKHGVVPAEMA